MRLGKMCRFLVVIMQTFKSQSGKTTCTLFHIDNKSCHAYYMIALKIYILYTLWVHSFIFVKKCNSNYFCLPEPRWFKIFLSNIHLQTFTLLNQYFFRGQFHLNLEQINPSWSRFLFHLIKRYTVIGMIEKVQNKKRMVLKLVLGHH